MKAIRIILLVLILIGLGLLFTQNLWVPKLVAKIIERESPTPFVLERPVASSTQQIPKPSVLEYGEVTLKIGEIAKFPNLSIALVRVFDDSRCPAGVQCVWAGTVKAELEITSGVGTSTSVVELRNITTTEAEEIVFLSATPHPKMGVGISPSDYAVTLRVMKRSADIPAQ